MREKQRRRGKHLYFFLACIITTLIFINGCAHFYEGFVTRSDFKEANDFTGQGNYRASLLKYEQIIAHYPRVGDRVLFEMGVIYAFSGNMQKDYQKSLDCFQKLIKDYPESSYRQNSEVLISLINEVTSKEMMTIVQRKKIDKLEQELEVFEKKIGQMKEVDMNLKQRKKPVH
jgi:tetratricopeptide (TPR) repeat protein